MGAGAVAVGRGVAYAVQGDGVGHASLGRGRLLGSSGLRGSLRSTGGAAGLGVALGVEGGMVGLRGVVGGAAGGDDCALGLGRIWCVAVGDRSVCMGSADLVSASGARGPRVRIAAASLLDSRLCKSAGLPCGSIRLSLVDQPLFVPAGSVVCLGVSSADVIHCYSVPGLGVKVDAIPGRVSWVSMSPLVPG